MEGRSSEAELRRAEAVLASACDAISQRYAFLVTGWAGPLGPAAADAGFRRNLVAATNLALLGEDGVEGGIWQDGTGLLAYAFPTYAGPGPKSDLPAAEKERVASVNEAAARAEQPATEESTAHGGTLLLRACPLGGPVSSLTAWTMTRISTQDALAPFRLGLALLLGLFLVISGALLWTLLVWSRRLSGLERALADEPAGSLTRVPPTGEAELDRVVDALNDAFARLAAQRVEAEKMASRVTRAERLAGLGRVAAGVAHEIRNPIAAARLQGENALAGGPARHAAAIAAMIAQLDRLDILASELLAMTQRAAPDPVETEIDALLQETARRHEPMAARRGVQLRREASGGTARLDPAMIGRALDNLVANAVRHAPDGGSVRLSAEREGGCLALVVADDGPGIAPTLQANLFEPFVTGRADGTGLGLAIARELADAHGGRLVLREAGGANGGAVFALELPWQRHEG